MTRGCSPAWVIQLMIWDLYVGYSATRSGFLNSTHYLARLGVKDATKSILLWTTSSLASFDREMSRVLT